jgi:carboxypeptidase family protein
MIGLGASFVTMSLPANGMLHQPPATIFVATVADAETGAPLVGAEVSMPSLGRTVVTDWIGEAHITGVPPGNHPVSVKKIGYVAARLSIAFSGDTVGQFFALGRTPRMLDTVRTTGTLQVPAYLHDFEVRRRMGIGRFLTDSILVKEPNTPIAEVMSRRFPGLRVVGYDRTVASMSCGHIDVYIDGDKTSWLSPDVTDLSSLVGDDVAGVEYYARGSAPVQYRLTSAACGVLLIWLKF